MIKKLKEWGWGFLGFAMMCGFLVIGAILLVGVAKVSAILYPIFNALSAISLLLFFFIILPLSLINNARPFLAQASIVLSYICGAALWMYSFLVIFYILGWWALFLFFWFRAVTFVAAIGLFFKGQWLSGGSILLMLVVVYGMRFYGFWLASLYDKRESSKTNPKLSPKEIGSGVKICLSCYKKNNPTFNECWKCHAPLNSSEEENEEIKKLIDATQKPDWKDLKQKTVNECLESLKEAESKYPAAAFQLLKKPIENYIRSKPDELVHFIQQSGRSAQEWVYSHISNIAGDHLESGHHHIYRGVLSPMGPGEDLLKIFDSAYDELLKMSAFDEKYANEQKAAVRKNIADMG